MGFNSGFKGLMNKLSCVLRKLPYFKNLHFSLPHVCKSSPQQLYYF